MSFSALNSELLGPLFATGAMRAVFSDQARLAAMLRAEAALVRAQARCGLTPEALAAAIAAIPAEDLDLAALGQGTGLAGVPTIPFVKAVQARLPKKLERSFHKGATTQDIVDTALVLQMRDALAPIADDLTAVVAALRRWPAGIAPLRASGAPTASTPPRSRSATRRRCGAWASRRSRTNCLG